MVVMRIPLLCFESMFASKPGLWQESPIYFGSRVHAYSGLSFVCHRREVGAEIRRGACTRGRWSLHTFKQFRFVATGLSSGLLAVLFDITARDVRSTESDSE